MTLVSTIISTLDRPEYLEGAVESALAQTHEDLEVLVVCDPPVERSRAVLDRFDDDRVRAIYNDERLGIAASRNRGIEAARGDFVCVLDDDDRWTSRKVARQLAVFEENPDCGVVYAGGVCRKDGQLVHRYEPERRGDIYPEILADFGLHPYSSHMIRAECLETVGGYDPAFERGEDWDLAIRLAREYEFDYVPDPLVTRQIHEENVSNEYVRQESTDVDEGTDIPSRIWRKYREEFRRYPRLERRMKRKRILSVGLAEIDRNNRLRALRYGLAASKYGPSMRSLAIVTLACLGPTALETIRTVRYSVNDSRLSREDPRLEEPDERVVG